MSMNDVSDSGFEARRLRRELIDDDLLDRLIQSTSDRGIELTGQGGFLTELIKAVLERGMQAELTEHLGYDKHDASGRGSGNSRKSLSSFLCKWWVMCWGIGLGSGGRVLRGRLASFGLLVECLKFLGPGDLSVVH